VANGFERAVDEKEITGTNAQRADVGDDLLTGDR
jgi:hypothetical protein